MKIGINRTALTMLCAISIIAVNCLPDQPLPPCYDGSIGGEDTWSEVYLGSDTTVPYLPDVYSNYWATGFNINGQQDLGFRIHGSFAYARYMSFNVYDAAVGTPLTGILDRYIQPNCNNENPFDGGQNDSDERSYLVHLVPQGTNTSALVNPLIYDPSIENIAVLMRYYVPEGNDSAQVSLPKIEAFDIHSGNPVPLPATASSEPPDPAEFEDRIEAFFATQIDDNVRFYNINSGGLFANIDNKYLASAIDRSDGRLIAIRFRPPVMADTKDEIVGAQVRYWSLNLSAPNTFTYAGIRDENAVGNENDWVHFLIGDSNDDAVMQVAAENGFNYLPWNLPGNKGLLVYRNLVTRDFFDGDIDRVPLLNDSNPINVLLIEAKNFIGPYAPRGIRISRDAFLADPQGVF